MRRAHRDEAAAGALIDAVWAWRRVFRGYPAGPNHLPLAPRFARRALLPLEWLGGTLTREEKPWPGGYNVGRPHYVPGGRIRGRGVPWTAKQNAAQQK